MTSFKSQVKEYCHKIIVVKYFQIFQNVKEDRIKGFKILLDKYEHLNHVM